MHWRLSADDYFAVASTASASAAVAAAARDGEITKQLSDDGVPKSHRGPGRGIRSAEPAPGA